MQARARLIHQEIAGAQVLAQRKGLDPNVFTAPLYDELARLYRDNFACALLADQADLVARYGGSGVVDNHEPPLSLLSCLFGKIKEKARAIARAIAGRESCSQLPSLWDLAGDGQAVQTAVQSLPAIPGLIQDGQMGDAIQEQFTDPAEHVPVMVTPGRLAPSAQCK